jgi:hypothetical protein
VNGNQHVFFYCFETPIVVVIHSGSGNHKAQSALFSLVRKG